MITAELDLRSDAQRAAAFRAIHSLDWQPVRAGRARCGISRDIVALVLATPFALWLLGAALAYLAR